MSRLFTLLLSLALVVGVLGAPAPRHDAVRPAVLPLSRVAVISDSYTAGSDEGGLGPKGWPTLAWQLLARQGIPVAADVAAEGGAGYGTRGNRGNMFEDLAIRAVRPDDALVVFFGSRNDEHVNPVLLPVLIYGTLQRAYRTAPGARFLIVGPAWPTADPPPWILRIRDALDYQARLIGARFVDPIAARWFVDNPELIGGDGVHPTDAGHAYMAERIAPLIADMLMQRF
ncbi:GDSL lipase [uncultured Mycolicibacterium sp.]|uniref:Rv0518 family GDSL lipase n=1 Tax=uncultured Mycolicibacterium sp. TaxID=2320817 RepID=UPI00262C9A4B|nr:GDSL lipase [uncultured Mycolicibacterium sp.]